MKKKVYFTFEYIVIGLLLVLGVLGAYLSTGFFNIFADPVAKAGAILTNTYPLAVLLIIFIPFVFIFFFVYDVIVGLFFFSVSIFPMIIAFMRIFKLKKKNSRFYNAYNEFLTVYYVVAIFLILILKHPMDIYYLLYVIFGGLYIIASAVRFITEMNPKKKNKEENLNLEQA